MPGETSSASADSVKHSPIIIMDIKYLIKKLYQKKKKIFQILIFYNINVNPILQKYC